MITRLQIETISQYSIFPQPDVPQSCPVVRLEDHHVVQETAGVVAELLRPPHRAQDLLGHREEGAVLDEAQDLALLLLNTAEFLLRGNKTSWV